jgi:hypothetical protein
VGGGNSAPLTARTAPGRTGRERCRVLARVWRRRGCQTPAPVAYLWNQFPPTGTPRPAPHHEQ